MTGHAILLGYEGPKGKIDFHAFEFRGYLNALKDDGVIGDYSLRTIHKEEDIKEAEAGFVKKGFPEMPQNVKDTIKSKIPKEKQFYDYKYPTDLKSMQMHEEENEMRSMGQWPPKTLLSTIVSIKDPEKMLKAFPALKKRYGLEMEVYQ